MDKRVLIPFYIEYLKDVWKRDKKEIMEKAEKDNILPTTFGVTYVDTFKAKKIKSKKNDMIEYPEVYSDLANVTELSEKKPRRFNDELPEVQLKWKEEEAFLRFKKQKHLGEEKARKAWNSLNLAQQKKF